MTGHVQCRPTLGSGRTWTPPFRGCPIVREAMTANSLNYSAPSMWAEIASASVRLFCSTNHRVSKIGQHTGQHKGLKGQPMTVLAKIEDEFGSHLSDGRTDEDRRMIFAQAILFLMRDDYAGSVLFDAWEIGRVIKMLAVSANIKARWQEVGRIEKQVSELIPEMRNLVDRLILFKALIDDKPTWERFEDLLPDRFLKAVWRAFNGPADCPQFYRNVMPHDGRATPKTEYAGLLLGQGGRHG